MNYRTLTAALLTITITVFSSSIFASAQDEICDGLHELGTAIMDARQSGIPIQTLMSYAENNFESVMADWMKGTIIDAYEVPKISGDVYQDKSITEFSNQLYVKCYKAAESD